MVLFWDQGKQNLQAKLKQISNKTDKLSKIKEKSEIQKQHRGRSHGPTWLNRLLLANLKRQPSGKPCKYQIHISKEV